MLDIHLNNIFKNTFFLRKCEKELAQVADSSFYHIILFSEECRCELNFQKFKAKKNQVLCLNSTDVYFCENKNDIAFHLSIKDEIFDKEHCETQRLISGLLFNNLLNNPFLQLLDEEAKNFESYLKEIQSLQSKSDYKNVETLFRKILTQAIVKKHNQNFYQIQISKNHHIVYKYLSLVTEHFKMEHNVFVYAQILGLQPKILTKIFYDLKIENPKSYLNYRILLETKKMLAYSSNKSTEISYEAGFNEPAYFARFFKKNMGLTPKQFRAKQILKIN